MAAVDVVVALHFAFVVFVVAGGLLTLRWQWVAWLHLPAAFWGALVEFADLPCPLTTLEYALSGAPQDAGFVARLLLPVLYPDLIRPGLLTPGLQFALGSAVVVINAAVYGYAIRRRRQRRAVPSP